MNENDTLEVAYILCETALRAEAIVYRENAVNDFDNTETEKRIVALALELAEILDATESLEN